MDISSNRFNDDDDDGDIIIAIYNTGIKVTNRGPQWIQEEKWQIKKKNGYIKIHIAVDIKNKKIFAFLEITDDDEKVQTMKERLCQN